MKAFFIGNSVSIFICLLQFTEEANDLVTIVTFLSVHWHFLTDHAATLANELSLEVVFNGIRINLHKALRLREATLAKDAVDLVVCQHKVVSV